MSSPPARPAAAHLDARSLLLGLVDILSQGHALALQFERLARDLGVPSGQATVTFYTGLKKIIRELPDQAFAERNARISMLDAVQDALDTVVEALEAEEDAAAAAGTPLAGGQP